MTDVFFKRKVLG